MLNLVALALLQIASLTDPPVTVTTTVTTTIDVMVVTQPKDGGTGGWGSDKPADGGTGGWGSDKPADGGTGGWGSDIISK
jgi:hypothetical protein